MTLTEYAASYGVDLAELIAFLANHQHRLRQDHWDALRDFVHPTDDDDRPRTVEEFSLSDEVMHTVNLIRKMRSRLEADGFQDMRATKDTVTAATQLLTQLTKVQDQIWNMERLKKLEDAVVASMREMPADVHLKFMDIVSRHMV